MRVCQFRHFGTACVPQSLATEHCSHEYLVFQTLLSLSIAAQFALH